MRQVGSIGTTHGHVMGQPFVAKMADSRLSLYQNKLWQMGPGEGDRLDAMGGGVIRVACGRRKQQREADSGR
jgi:hypothetical protein